MNTPSVIWVSEYKALHSWVIWVCWVLERSHISLRWCCTLSAVCFSMLNLGHCKKSIKKLFTISYKALWEQFKLCLSSISIFHDFSKGVNSHLMFTSCISEGTGNGCRGTQFCHMEVKVLSGDLCGVTSVGAHHRVSGTLVLVSLCTQWQFYECYKALTLQMKRN